MIKNYFKIALRNFWRHKLFTFINIIGLSIGISAALVIYLIVQFDFSFDRFHPGGDRIYRVVSNFNFEGESIHNGGVTGMLADAAKSSVTGLEASAPFYTASDYTVETGANSKTPTLFKHENDIIYADGSYFTVFSYKWLAGSRRTALNEPNRVVLASQQAKKYFPSLSYSQMIGREIVYEDTIRAMVSGVVQEFTQNSDLTFHDFISYSTIKSIRDIYSQLNSWSSTNGSSQFYVKLLPGTAVKKVEKQMNALWARNDPPQKGRTSTENFSLQPLSDLHFNADYYAYDNAVVNKSTLYGLMAVAAFLLTLGCINFINLTTAQGTQRAKEIGIRKTLGSGKKQLIFQFLSETFLITIFAVVVSAALLPLLLKLFADFTPKGLQISALWQPGVFIFLFCLIIVVGLLSGFYPALVLSSFRPVSVLKNQSLSRTSKTRGAWMRKSLTVTQFCIAQFFIMATMLVSKQIYFALHTDLGFKKEAIIYIQTPWKQRDSKTKQVFFNDIKEIPGIELSSIGGQPPSSNGWNSSDVNYTDGKRDIKTDLQIKAGDENYIKVYGIKLLAGRNIRMSDTASNMLINETYAHTLGFQNVRDALGKTISFGKTEKRQIVGIVGDFHQASLHASVKPLAIFPQTYNFSTIHIALKPEIAGGNEWKQTIAAIQTDWKQVFPDDDFDYHFFDQNIAKMYESEQHTATLLAWATGLSILISCLGLLGLAIYTTNQRTKEIGVRKVLGASVAQIVTLLSAEMIWLILLAFAIVTPVAWWAMHKWMEGFADRTAISWWIFASGGAAMLLASLFTSCFQTIRAAIANPVKSLRSE